MSHLACSDDPDHPMNRRQLETFREVAAAYPDVEKSLAASAGIFLGPDYHFDLTRPGIANYGGKASAGGSTPLKTVVTAEAQIMTIRDARAGDVVSYGATAQLERDSRIAICSVGYADGYLRSLSGSGVPLRDAIKPGGFAWCAGHRIPVLGRVTMDITAFDVTDVPLADVQPGDFIELFGDNVLLDDVAERAGTIGYELLTSLGYRYHRRYVGRNAAQDDDG
jgi:alanine racemase